MPNGKEQTTQLPQRVWKQKLRMHSLGLGLGPTWQLTQMGVIPVHLPLWRQLDQGWAHLPLRTCLETGQCLSSAWHAHLPRP